MDGFMSYLKKAGTSAALKWGVQFVNLSCLFIVFSTLHVGTIYL